MEFFYSAEFEFELSNCHESIMAPSLEQLTARFESVCGKIQDSIVVIESQMVRQQEITFNINREIYSLGSMDISGTEDMVGRYINVLEEYKKMISYEKSRRRLDSQIKNADEIITFKEDLKKKRRAKRTQTLPYKKKELTKTV